MREDFAVEGGGGGGGGDKDFWCGVIEEEVEEEVVVVDCSAGDFDFRGGIAKKEGVVGVADVGSRGGERCGRELEVVASRGLGFRHQPDSQNPCSSALTNRDPTLKVKASVCAHVLPSELHTYSLESCSTSYVFKSHTTLEKQDNYSKASSHRVIHSMHDTGVLLVQKIHQNPQPPAQLRTAPKDTKSFVNSVPSSRSQFHLQSPIPTS